MNKYTRIIRYQFDMGRHGYLDCTQVITDEEWDFLQKPTRVYFGEVLGKHSEVEVDVLPQHIKVISDHPDEIKLFLKFFPSGQVGNVNLMEAIKNDIEDNLYDQYELLEEDGDKYNEDIVDELIDEPLRGRKLSRDINLSTIKNIHLRQKIKAKKLEEIEDLSYEDYKSILEDNIENVKLLATCAIKLQDAGEWRHSTYYREILWLWEEEFKNKPIPSTEEKIIHLLRKL